jgi:hypothetical protein
MVVELEYSFFLVLHWGGLVLLGTYSFDRDKEGKGMRRLDQGYEAEVDLIDKENWHRLMLQFKDASFYQTWSFGARRFGEKGLSHIVLTKNGKLVSMAQVQIIRCPALPIGVAYVSWGPMVRSDNEGPEDPHYRNMIRAINNEYVFRRRFYLRIVPQLLDTPENAVLKEIFTEEGYSRRDSPGQNVIIDLAPTLEEIRQNMNRKWRQTLQSAEKKSLHIIETSDNRTCRLALEVVREMKNRKQFVGGNQAEIIKIQMDLPESLKLKLLVCMDDNAPTATLGWVTFGSIGIPFVAATGIRALKTNSSYVLWWRMIEYYKTRGFIAVDAGSVNKKRNPGGYLFKTHILGKVIENMPRYIGHFDQCSSWLSRVFFIGLYKIREVSQDVRHKF